MKYFAYGSNCNPAIMRNKQVNFSSSERAVLLGYRLRFNKRALRPALPEQVGFANIVPEAKASVEGILYEIDDRHLGRLDESERFPDHYDRIQVTVKGKNGPCECFTYQAVPGVVAEGLVPSRNYLNHILAAKDFMSRQYFEALDKSLTYRGECACCHEPHEIVFVREDDRLFMLCRACQEARGIWGDTRGRKFSIAETEATVSHLRDSGKSYHSLPDLLQDLIKLRIVDR